MGDFGEKSVAVSQIFFFERDFEKCKTYIAVLWPWGLHFKNVHSCATKLMNSLKINPCQFVKLHRDLKLFCVTACGSEEAN